MSRQKTIKFTLRSVFGLDVKCFECKKHLDDEDCIKCTCGKTICTNPKCKIDHIEKHIKRDVKEAIENFESLIEKTAAKLPFLEKAYKEETDKEKKSRKKYEYFSASESIEEYKSNVKTRKKALELLKKGHIEKLFNDSSWFRTNFNYQFNCFEKPEHVHEIRDRKEEVLRKYRKLWTEKLVKESREENMLESKKDKLSDYEKEVLEKMREFYGTY